MATPGPKPGRAQRPRSVKPRSLIQAYVSPDTKTYVGELADVCGVSVASLVELMILNQALDPATGRPTWWDQAAPTYFGRCHEEELPLTA